MRFRELRNELEDMGFQYEGPTNNGHEKFEDPSGAQFIVPHGISGGRRVANYMAQARKRVRKAEKAKANEGVGSEGGDDKLEWYDFDDVGLWQPSSSLERLTGVDLRRMSESFHKGKVIGGVWRFEQREITAEDRQQITMSPQSNYLWRAVVVNQGEDGGAASDRLGTSDDDTGLSVNGLVAADSRDSAAPTDSDAFLAAILDKWKQRSEVQAAFAYDMPDLVPNTLLEDLLSAGAGDAQGVSATCDRILDEVDDEIAALNAEVDRQKSLNAKMRGKLGGTTARVNTLEAENAALKAKCEQYAQEAQRAYDESHAVGGSDKLHDLGRLLFEDDEWPSHEEILQTAIQRLTEAKELHDSTCEDSQVVAELAHPDKLTEAVIGLRDCLELENLTPPHEVVWAGVEALVAADMPDEGESNRELLRKLVIDLVHHAIHEGLGSEHDGLKDAISNLATFAIEN